MLQAHSNAMQHALSDIVQVASGTRLRLQLAHCHTVLRAVSGTVQLPLCHALLLASSLTVIYSHGHHIFCTVV